MPRVAFIVVILTAAFLPGAALAQVDPGTLIIAGAGWAGNWDTEIELSDTWLPGGTNGSVAKYAGFLPALPCPPLCFSTSFEIPADGTVRLLASEFLSEGFEGPQMLRVTTITEQPLPVVRARIFNRARPSQSAELPVFFESTLDALDTRVLVFSGVRRLPGVHSNLILQTIGNFEGVAVLLEAFDANGALLVSEVVTVPPETTSPALTLVDVAARLGATELDGGQVRVTRQSGEAVVWGVLATVYDDGRLTVGIGANP